MPELDAAPTLDQVVQTARGDLAWALSEAARARMQQGCEVAERALASEAVVYG